MTGRDDWRQSHKVGWWLELWFRDLGLHPSYLTLGRIPNCTEAQFYHFRSKFWHLFHKVLGVLDAALFMMHLVGSGTI